MSDAVTALDRDVNELEHKLETWESACRLNVADTLAASELDRVRLDNSRGGIPLATESALAQYEETWRGQYDTARAVEGTVLEAETSALRTAITEAIEKAETLKGERDMARGSGEHLQAGILEELVGQRLRSEVAAMTVSELAAAYDSWTDEADRTAVRMVEAAVTTRLGLSRLRLQSDDPTSDALAIQALQKRVAERRRARVPSALYEQQARVAKLWNLPRTHLRSHLAEGRGIAKRPRTSTARIGHGGTA